MLKRWMVALGIVILVGSVAAQEQPQLKNEKEKLSYALGMDLGNQLRKLSVDVDPTPFGKGLGDSLSGNKTLLSEEEARAAIAGLEAEMKRRQAEARKAGMEDKK